MTYYDIHSFMIIKLFKWKINCVLKNGSIWSHKENYEIIPWIVADKRLSSEYNIIIMVKRSLHTWLAYHFISKSNDTSKRHDERWAYLRRKLKICLTERYAYRVIKCDGIRLMLWLRCTTFSLLQCRRNWRSAMRCLMHQLTSFHGQKSKLSSLKVFKWLMTVSNFGHIQIFFSNLFFFWRKEIVNVTAFMTIHPKLCRITSSFFVIFSWLSISKVFFLFHDCFFRMKIKRIKRRNLRN